MATKSFIFFVYFYNASLNITFYFEISHLSKMHFLISSFDLKEHGIQNKAIVVLIGNRGSPQNPLLYYV